ncbi:hypothetical protein F4861DRAFT_387023 [Xylaria intraflava]|nr:hypothetical protein F4861DRAFT_387023 [Xylaria intraflava]
MPLLTFPKTSQQWHDMVKNQNLESQSIFNTEVTLKSASEIGFHQFLLLRVLIIPSQHVTVFSRTTSHPEWYQTKTLRTSASVLEADRAWMLYLESIRQPSSPRSHISSLAYLGVFSQVRHYQLEIQPQSTPDAEQPPSTRDVSEAVSEAANDEQTVNMALIVCLNAITMSSCETTGKWTPHQKSFTVRSQRNKKAYTAMVDGYLKSSTGRVTAIVEVKPYIRPLTNQTLQMQEAGEMVAWIAADPPDVQKMRKEDKPCRRLLVSQNSDQIYITIGECDANYVDYVCDRPIRKGEDPFLKMERYGPFEIGVSRSMSVFGKIMLAFAIDQSILD